MIVIIIVIVVTISTCALLWAHTLANIIQELAPVNTEPEHISLAM